MEDFFDIVNQDVVNQDVVKIDSESEVIPINADNDYYEVSFPYVSLGRDNWSLLEAICVTIRERINNLKVYNCGLREIFIAIVKYNNE